MLRTPWLASPTLARFRFGTSTISPSGPLRNSPSPLNTAPGSTRLRAFIRSEALPAASETTLPGANAVSAAIWARLLGRSSVPLTTTGEPITRLKYPIAPPRFMLPAISHESPGSVRLSVSEAARGEAMLMVPSKAGASGVSISSALMVKAALMFQSAQPFPSMFSRPASNVDVSETVITPFTPM